MVLTEYLKYLKKTYIYGYQHAFVNKDHHENYLFGSPSSKIIPQRHLKTSTNI
jgi:hypothetical protein